MKECIEYIFGFLDTILKFLTKVSLPIDRATFLNILPGHILQTVFGTAIILCCVWSILKVLRG